MRTASGADGRGRRATKSTQNGSIVKLADLRVALHRQGGPFCCSIHRQVSVLTVPAEADRPCLPTRSPCPLCVKRGVKHDGQSQQIVRRRKGIAALFGDKAARVAHHQTFGDGGQKRHIEVEYPAGHKLARL
jgi:hypothetical protein